MRSPWMSSSYQKMPGLKRIKRVVDDKEFYILLNEELGSWMVFTQAAV